MDNGNESKATDNATEHSDLKQLVCAMLEQSRLREQQMSAIVNRLIDNKRNDSAAPTMVPNHTQIIPVFTGESGDTDAASEWMNALKTVALLNRWPDICTLEAGRSHLEGAARHWFLSHMAELDTLEKFTTSFERMFTSQESITETWKKMSERAQQRGETVFAYFHDKVRMCRRLGLPAKETKKMICIGLLSRDMCAALLSNSHTSEEELLSDIRMYTEVNLSRGERLRPGIFERRPATTIHDKPVDKSLKFGNNDKSLNNHMKKGNVTNKTTVSGPRCYNCQQNGHISRDCTLPRKPMKCVKCQAEGHTSKYCRVTEPDVNCISSQMKKNIMHYVKEVRINDHEQPIRGLIDTGSAYSIIRRSVAEHCGLEVRPNSITMWVYGNSQTVDSSGETTAMIHIDEVSERITLIVVDDHVQGYDIIVGRSFTDCDNVTFIN